MNAWTRRAAVLTLVCLLITALGAAWAYRVLWQRYDTGLAQLQARGERLEGIVDAGPQITQQLQAARSAVSPWLHPAGENAANALQQSLRERIAASGNTQVSSQAALEAAADDTLARVQASTAITGTWSGSWTLGGMVVGTVSVNLTQAGSSISGTMSVMESPCVSAGTVTGSVSGSSVAMHVLFSGGEEADLIGTMNDDQMAGTYELHTGACASAGDWVMSR